MFLNSGVRLKKNDDIGRIRESGKIISEIFNALHKLDFTGLSTEELDKFTEQLIRRYKVRPSFKTVVGYNHATCISINDEVVHGIPSKKKIIKAGDVVKVDIGVVKQGYFADACETFIVPPVTDEAEKLVQVTREALHLGIAQALPGNRLGDIGAVIQNYVEKKGYSIVRDYTGHGVGFALHEAPAVFHFGEKGTGLALVEGLVICIEPMVNIGKCLVRTLDDGWTVVTEDGSLSAQFEHTIVITKDGPDILTF